VVAEVAANLAAEYPIRPSDVHEDHGQQRERTDQNEGLRTVGRCRLLQREVMRHNHGIKTDSDAEIGEHE
jgi:hypothetical protein